MIGKIIEIIDNSVIIELAINIVEQPNLVNLHIILENDNKKIVAEIANVNKVQMRANIVGEIVNNIFIPGSSNKPSFKSVVRLITTEELAIMFGDQNLKKGFTNFGYSRVYEGYKINVPINDFFSTHFAVLGNSGSGKSSFVASTLQKLFMNKENIPVNSSFFFFDAYGEYNNVFTELHSFNPKLNYKTYTTNILNPDTEILRIPIWLLDVDDLALLLDASTPNQLPIIEKTLKLVRILTGNTENIIRRKNDIIARALEDILLSGRDSTKIRDQVVGVLTKFNTPTLNLESQIVQPGYTRTLRQCLYIDKTGKMQEMDLVVEFIRAYIIDEAFEIPQNELTSFYNLNDLEMAMEFALISEGVLKSDKVFDDVNIMSVRLHSLATGDSSHYFSYPSYITKDQYIDILLHDESTGGKAQIINFNINYVDDRIAKVITKIISRMLFSKASSLIPRGGHAFHIIIEEAHRYVNSDRDISLLGYNIFERIAKEGRKYGILLSLISQRPSELSDTCISQCMNFVIFRTLHPLDLNYIREMVPNVSQEIVLQLKNLKPGNCIAFGSAFKVPTFMYVDMPNPRPLSDNVNLEKIWYDENIQITTTDAINESVESIMARTNINNQNIMNNNVNNNQNMYNQNNFNQATGVNVNN